LTNEISHATLTPRPTATPVQAAIKSRALTLGLAIGLPLLVVVIVVLVVVLRRLRKGEHWHPLDKSLDLGRPVKMEDVQAL
jgi:heme/copper-type cytochrome/quinol oxidase subunit 2